MKRSLSTAPPILVAPAILAAVLTASLAGCGSSSSPSSAAAPTIAPTTAAAAGAPAPAPPGATVAGIPTLGGTPTDVKTAPMINAGTGQPPAQLLTQDVVLGTGKPAAAHDTVNVRYSGALYDGTMFDSSWSQGDQPISFSLDEVVPGFAQGIVGMAPGGRRVIVIPPDLGYGATTKGPIPGGSTLVFVVDYVGTA